MFELQGCLHTDTALLCAFQIMLICKDHKMFCILGSRQCKMYKYAIFDQNIPRLAVQEL